MKKLRTLKGAALLRKYSDKKAIIRNDTRWSSAYQMLSRYDEFSSFLSHHEFQEFNDLLLSPLELLQLRNLLKALLDFEKVTKKLQCASTTVAYSRRLFSALITKYPAYSLESKRGHSADIICDPIFENTIVKIMENKPLLHSEKTVVRHLMKQQPLGKSMAEVDQDDILAIAAATEDENEIKDEYGDLRYILPTSNHVERLFSAAGRCMDDYRHSEGVLEMRE
jgi:hypothetical protein